MEGIHNCYRPHSLDLLRRKFQYLCNVIRVGEQSHMPLTLRSHQGGMPALLCKRNAVPVCSDRVFRVMYYEDRAIESMAQLFRHEIVCGHAGVAFQPTLQTFSNLFC
jgi:hypothetical protein